MSETVTEQEVSKWITVKILRSQFKEISKIVAASSGYANEVEFIRAANREKISRWHKN